MLNLFIARYGKLSGEIGVDLTAKTHKMKDAVLTGNYRKLICEELTTLKSSQNWQKNRRKKNVVN